MTTRSYVLFSTAFIESLADLSDAEYRATIDGYCRENKRRRLLREEVGAHRENIRRQLEDRDGQPECAYCGTIDRIVIDHIKPLCRGGTNDLDNLQFLCHTCNESKGGA